MADSPPVSEILDKHQCSDENYQPSVGTTGCGGRAASGVVSARQPSMGCEEIVRVVGGAGGWWWWVVVGGWWWVVVVG